MLTNRYTIALLLYTLAWPVQAQVSTPAPFINPESAAPAAEKEAEPVIDNQAERKAAPELGKPLNDVSLNVSAYRIEGVEAKHLNDIQKLLVPYVGEKRSFEDLSSAAQVVTAFLQRELGYYLAYAICPRKTLKTVW